MNYNQANHIKTLLDRHRKAKKDIELAIGREKLNREALVVYLYEEDIKGRQGELLLKLQPNEIRVALGWEGRE